MGSDKNTPASNGDGMRGAAMGAEMGGGKPAANTRIGPRVGVIYNPRSHKNKGQDLDSQPAPHVYVAQPGGQSQLPAALERFVARDIELLVINGGDGTVRDVLTAGYKVFGDKWPTIAVLPKGKTNALTVDLDAPNDWTLQGAIDAYRDGKRIVRAPMVIASDDSPDAQVNLGFIMGAGVFTLGIRAGQDAHRFGAFNSLAVGVATVWSVLQAILGGKNNRWRRGVALDVLLGQEEKPLENQGNSATGRRLVMFASTLERFPAGLKPFGNFVAGLKLAVLDHASRRKILRLPLVVMGRNVDDLNGHGFHQLTTDKFIVELDDALILDGEEFPAGKYHVSRGPNLEFVTP